MRQSIFISDIHLSDDLPEVTEQFINFLSSVDSSLDALYVLGDLFNYWLGDDYVTEVSKQTKLIFRQLHERGVKVFFIHGNRDFLIGKKFSTDSRCVILAEMSKINLYGTPILLMHGDLLCTLDRNYLRMRKIFHAKYLQKIFLMLPLKMRKKFGKYLRTESTRANAKKSAVLTNVNQRTVEVIMNQYHVNFLIHGHTHQTAIHEFKEDHEKKYRIVLSDWGKHSNALVWYDNGTYELKRIASLCSGGRSAYDTNILSS